MPEFKNHVLVCDVERDDGAHCGNKGGAEVKRKVIEMLSKHGLRSDVYVSSVGCTSQHRLCDMQQCSMIVYAVSYTHLSCRRSTLCRSRWSPYH